MKPQSEAARLDAQEIKNAVAHQDAARAMADAPFVNLADPARALGSDGRPAVSRRAPIFEDVPDEQWNDWRWQLSHRVNDLHEIEQILHLTPEERAGLSAPDKFRVDITPVLHQPDRSRRSRTTRSVARSSRSAPSTKPSPR